MESGMHKDSFKVAGRLTALRVYNTGTQRCEPGYRWGPGVRDHYLIHCILEGRGTYTVRGVTYELVQGDLFLAQPDEVITYRADTASPWAYCWVGFNGPDAGALLRQTDFTPERPVLHPADEERSRELLLDIYRVRGNQPHDIAAMAGRLYLFLAWLMETARQEAGDRQQASWTHVQLACTYIANNFANPIGVAEIASHVGVSRSLLYRAFQAQLSMSPVQYLAQFRIRQACRLLERGALSVKAVAYSVGFEDPLYFSRRFRDLVGCTPGAYQKNPRKWP